MGGALLVWVAYAALPVFGDGDCPAPAAVSARLAALLPIAPEAAAPAAAHARVTSTASAVHVDLFGARGERLAERDLADSGTCADLAAAVAVVIAAWQADIDPHVAVSVGAGAAVPAASVSARSSPPPASAARPPSFAVGVALIASLAGGRLAPGARVEGWVASAGWRVGVGAALSAAADHTEAVGSLTAAARWSRFGFGLGPEAHFDVRGAVLDAHAQVVGAVLRVGGAGLRSTDSDASGELGVGAGAHVGWPWGRALPWLGVEALLWPGDESLVVGGVAAKGALPRFELQLALGMSLGRFQ